MTDITNKAATQLMERIEQLEAEREELTATIELRDAQLEAASVLVRGAKEPYDIMKTRAESAEARTRKAIDVLDGAIGDTDPEEIDYSERPHGPMIHAMHMLLGIDNATATLTILDAGKGKQNDC